jgi:hypothetical protein
VRNVLVTRRIGRQTAGGRRRAAVCSTARWTSQVETRRSRLRAEPRESARGLPENAQRSPTKRSPRQSYRPVLRWLEFGESVDPLGDVFMLLLPEGFIVPVAPD